MSIQSTGPVFSCGGNTFITDCKNYSGTYIYDVYGNRKGKTDALMWYAVCYENTVYFSNQNCNNYLYRMNTDSGLTEKAVDVPCKNLVGYNGHILFIDEKNGGIWAYNCKTWAMYKAADIQAESFTVLGSDIYYTSKGTIGCYSLVSKTDKTVANVAAKGLNCYGNYLIFSDFKKKGALSLLNPANGQLFVVGAITTDSFAVYENYVFASNETEGKSINRIDISKGEILRIYGDAAYEICACGGFLYFQNDQKDWCRMTVSGESFTKISF